MNEEQTFKCRECDFVSYDAEVLHLHRREHGPMSANMVDTLGKWTTPMVKLLIMLYIDNKNKFGSINWASKRIWANVAASMNEMGYVVNPHQCSEKWRNLKKSYIKIRDTIGKTGSRRNKWEFYYEMEEALGDNYNSSSVNSKEDSNDMSQDMSPGQESSNQPNATSEEQYHSMSELFQVKEQYSEPEITLPPCFIDTGESTANEENSLKRKLPTTEWYDKYLEELRAARHDKNKRHQDKQIFRQQLLDLCKQILISSSSKAIIKSESPS